MIICMRDGIGIYLLQTYFCKQSWRTSRQRKDTTGGSIGYSKGL